MRFGADCRLLRDFYTYFERFFIVDDSYEGWPFAADPPVSDFHDPVAEDVLPIGQE